MIDYINAYIKLFYTWLFSLPSIQRFITFILILTGPILLFMVLSTQAMPPWAAVLYVIYMLALIIGYVQKEEEYNA